MTTPLHTQIIKVISAGTCVWAGKMIFFPKPNILIEEDERHAFLDELPTSPSLIPSQASYEYEKVTQLLTIRPIKKTGIFLEPLNDLKNELDSLRDGVRTDFTTHRQNIRPVYGSFPHTEKAQAREAEALREKEEIEAKLLQEKFDKMGHYHDRNEQKTLTFTLPMGLIGTDRSSGEPVLHTDIGTNHFGFLTDNNNSNNDSLDWSKSIDENSVRINDYHGDNDDSSLNSLHVIPFDRNHLEQAQIITKPTMILMNGIQIPIIDINNDDRDDNSHNNEAFTDKIEEKTSAPSKSVQKAQFIDTYGENIKGQENSQKGEENEENSRGRLLLEEEDEDNYEFIPIKPQSLSLQHHYQAAVPPNRNNPLDKPQIQSPQKITISFVSTDGQEFGSVIRPIEGYGTDGDLIHGKKLV